MKNTDTTEAQVPETRTRRQAKAQGGNGAGPAGDPEDVRATGERVASESVDPSVFDAGRSLRDDASLMAETLTDAAGEIQGYLREQANRRPYAALGAAAGIGFVLGGGLSLRLTSTLLTIGGRLLVTALWQKAAQNATATTH